MMFNFQLTYALFNRQSLHNKSFLSHSKTLYRIVDSLCSYGFFHATYFSVCVLSPFIIMANFEDNNLEVMDEENLIITDFEEDPSEENIQQMDSILSPKLDFENGCYKRHKFPYKNIDHRSADDYTKFPEYIKRKEKMSIKDVVKEHALPFLPAKSLCRFRTVCKEWDKWIINPFLVHKQMNYFRDISGLFCQFPSDTPSFISFNRPAYGIPSPSLDFLPEVVDIRTTCNGLLCCQGHLGDNAYYICNPVSKEWKVLPKSTYYHGPEPAIVLVIKPSAFNFAPNYELVCAFFPLLDLPYVYFEIYSSRTNSWRLSATECCEVDCLKLGNNGFYMREFVYWETDSGAVLAFDIKNEQYGILALPLCSGPQGVLTEMHGELGYILPHIQDQGYMIDIYGGMDMSLKFTIPLDVGLVRNTSSPCRALGCVNDDILILLLGSRLIAYHVGAQKVEFLSNARNDGFARYLPYVNSLVSVNRPLLLGDCGV